MKAGPRLTIVADDYGYAGGYDEGILAAAEAGALDGVGAMVLREAEPEPLLVACRAAEAEIGLHLEPAPRVPFATQAAEFERRFGRPPAYLDGHHHCHAEPGEPSLAAVRLALELGVPMRSISPRHRRLLRCKGVATPDRLLGRSSEDEPAVPAEIAAWRERGQAPEAGGLVEWMVHPGRADATTGSSYDAGRERDLEALLGFGDREAWRRDGIARVRPSAAV